MKKFGGKAVAIQADVSKDDDRARLVKEALLYLGEINILINNAGV